MANLIDFKVVQNPRISLRRYTILILQTLQLLRILFVIPTHGILLLLLKAQLGRLLLLLQPGRVLYLLPPLCFCLTGSNLEPPLGLCQEEVRHFRLPEEVPYEYELVLREHREISLSFQVLSTGDETNVRDGVARGVQVWSLVRPRVVDSEIPHHGHANACLAFQLVAQHQLINVDNNLRLLRKLAVFAAVASSADRGVLWGLLGLGRGLIDWGLLRPMQSRKVL